MNLPNNNLMRITASSLQHNSPDEVTLRGEVRRHIKKIEYEISDAHKSKECSIIYEIERNFPVLRMRNRDAQIFVYSAIIDQLVLNGFHVRFRAEKSSFLISWENKLNKVEKQRQLELLSEAMSSDKRR